MADSLLSPGSGVPPRSGNRTCRRRCKVAGIFYRVLMFVFLIVVMAGVYGSKHLSDIDHKHVDVPTQLLLATVGVTPETSGTRNATCYPHLEFGDAAKGTLCLNPQSGRSAWRISVADERWNAPHVVHFGIHGPINASDDGTLAAPVFIALEPHSYIANEDTLVGVHTAFGENVAAVVRDPSRYYVELRSETGPLKSTLK